jgi:hypothetical protein
VGECFGPSYKNALQEEKEHHFMLDFEKG